MTTVVDAELIETAIRLVRTLADQALAELAADERAFREGYTLGFTAGRDVGYNQAEREQVEIERRTHLQLSGKARGRPFGALQRLRRQPGGEIYVDAVRRRGGMEYTGGPVEWKGSA